VCIDYEILDSEGHIITLDFARPNTQVALYTGAHTGCTKEKSSKRTAFVPGWGPISFFFLLADV
jgi:hypothetical protein